MAGQAMCRRVTEVHAEMRQAEVASCNNSAIASECHAVCLCNSRHEHAVSCHNLVSDTCHVF